MYLGTSGSPLISRLRFPSHLQAQKPSKVGREKGHPCQAQPEVALRPCPSAAHTLRMGFTFLNSWVKIERVILCDTWKLHEVHVSEPAAPVRSVSEHSCPVHLQTFCGHFLAQMAELSCCYRAHMPAKPSLFIVWPLCKPSADSALRPHADVISVRRELAPGSGLRPSAFCMERVGP